MRPTEPIRDPFDIMTGASACRLQSEQLPLVMQSLRLIQMARQCGERLYDMLQAGFQSFDTETYL